MYKRTRSAGHLPVVADQIKTIAQRDVFGRVQGPRRAHQ